MYPRSNSIKARSSEGMTLVEVLVSMSLGLLMVAAMIQTYLSTKQTARLSNGINRIQENARFAHFFVAKDLRSAGFSTCVGQVRNKLNGDPSDYISFTTSVSGWDYAGTETGNSAFELPSGSEAVTIPTSTNSWSGAGTLPDFVVGRAIAGTDILWFKNFEALDLVIKTHNDNASPIVTESAHGMPNNSILMVGDCTQVEMFQHLSNGNGNQVSLTANEGNNGDPGNRKTTGGVPNWGRVYTANDKIYGFKQTYYYIGEGASGQPALFKFSTNEPEATITASDFANTSQELVDGVETMQILYGEDLTPSDDENFPNTYVSASQVTDWDNVAAVKVAFLFRSTEGATGLDQGTEFTLLDNIKFKQSAPDSLLRYSVNTTVKLRNRSLDDNLAYNVCDITDDTNDIPTCTESIKDDEKVKGNNK